MGQLIPNESSVPALPSAPVWEWALLEQPWAAAGMLVLVGLVAAWLLAVRGRVRDGVLAGALGVGLAAGVWLLAMSVVTVRERVSSATRELVEAVERVDEPTMRSLLSEGVEATAPRAGTLSGRDRIVEAVRTQLPRHGVSSVEVLEVRAADDGSGVARTQARVRAQVGDGFVVHSWWELVWIEGDGEPAWRVRTIRALWIQGA